MTDNKPTPKFIVLDFNCSNEFTHHWSSVVCYAGILNRYGKQTEVWLPRNASEHIVKRISNYALVIRFLRSPQYSRASLINDTFGFLLGKLIQKIFGNKNQSNFKNCIRRFVVGIYTFKVLSKLREEIIKQKSILIFPTLDFLGFQVVKRLLKEKSDVQIHIRRIGLEQRHPLAQGDEFKELMELLNTSQIKNIRLGIPTENLFQEVQKSCKFPDRIYWSPLPPDPHPKSRRDLDSPNKIVIGFPGSARENKGYDQIEKIAEQLKFEGVDFSIFIQQANFPWRGYEASRAELKKVAGSGLIELEPVLSVADYESLFEFYDAIFLPYKATEYADADSGILYQAADWEVPIACFSGLGFSNEAFRYGIGLDLEESPSLKMMLEQMQSREMKENIRKYNQVREAAIINFLELV